MALATAVAAFACAQLLPSTSSSFSASTGNSGNTLTSAPDWTPPTVGATVIQKSQGGQTGFIRQGGTFRLYAAVTDTGNPASGVASVSASVSTIATVSTATLTSGSYTIAGTTYGYRSALLTAKASLSSGSYSYTINATDVAGNGPGTGSGSVTVDNSAFTGAGFAWDDSGSTTGRYEQGETIWFYYNKLVEPGSIVSGWDGSATSVQVRLDDKGINSTAVDILTVRDSSGSTLLPLGTVSLNGDYVPGGKTANFTATMTATNNRITIVLGTVDNTGNTRTSSPVSPFDWAPSSTAYDAAANPASTASVTGIAPSGLVPANGLPSIVGTPGAGDTVTYSFTAAPAPASILAGWNGSATSVTLRLADKNNVSYSSDTMTVLTGAGANVALGAVALNGDYVTGGNTVDFTNSTMVLSGTDVIVTLGTPNNANMKTDTGGRKPTWYPDAAITDAFGTPILTAPWTAGSNQIQF